MDINEEILTTLNKWKKFTEKNIEKLENKVKESKIKINELEINRADLNQVDYNKKYNDLIDLENDALLELEFINKRLRMLNNFIDFET